ncbi:Zinc finger protein SHOOT GRAVITROPISM 5, partial [Frankliniella fusca]
MSFKRYLMCVHCNPCTHHSDIDALSQHFFSRHRNLAAIKCGQCKKDFIHKSSLIRHIHTVHLDGSESSSSDSSTDSGSQPELLPHDNADVGDSDTVTNDEHEVEASAVGDMFTKLPQDPSVEASLFLMNLRTSGNLTHASIRIIQEHVDKLVSSVLQKTASETSQFLDKCGVSKEESSQFVEETFSNPKLFDGLNTIEDQLNYFAEKFGMVIPEDKYLDSRIENRFDSKKRMFLPSQVLETFQYVSLIDTLKIIVRNNFLRGLIENEEPSTDGVFRSFKDGSDFKNNTFLQKYPKAVRLILYQDDLEVANALGSKDTIHKLGCFYFSVQNFPPEESSLLASIFLLALCYAEDLKKKGAFSKVFTPLKEELKLLMSDQGVEVDLSDGEKYVIRACIVLMCADTLAAHAMLGLLSPSARKFCRLCMISKLDFARDSTAMGDLRESSKHDQHVQLVEADPSSATLYGVKEKSLLSDMMRVPEDAPFDIFHDLVGIIEMDLKLVLYEFVCVRKLFSVFDLNSRINMFDYGKPDIKNKPSPNFLRKKLMERGHKLKQNGSQTFCLLRIFPFIVTGVGDSDLFMKLVYILQDIVKILFSFELRNDDIVKLEGLIYEHNKLFHDIFVSHDENVDDEINAEGDMDEEREDEDEDVDEDEEQIGPRRPQSRKLKKGINKMHHWMHYSQIIRQKGPLIRLWCARFEARHRIFRKHSSVQSNFKNVPKTMARVFQLSTLSGIVLRTGSRGVIVAQSSGICSTVNKSIYCDLLLQNGFKGDEELRTVQSAEVCGEEYSSGLFVSLKRTCRQPVFGLIIDIIVKSSMESQAFLVVSRPVNIAFKQRFNAYQISNTFSEVNELVEVRNLSNHRPLAAWS